MIHRETLKKFNFMAVDGIGLILCILLSVMIKFGVSPSREQIKFVIDFFYILLGTHLVVFLFTGLYNIHKQDSMVDIIYRNFWVELFVVLILTVFFLVVRTYGFFNLYRPDLGTSRAFMVYLWLLVFLYITIWRLIYLIYQRSKGESVVRMAVVGSPEETGNISKSLEFHSSTGHRVIGIINPNPQKSTYESDIQEIPLQQMNRFVDENNIQEIIIAANLPPNRLIEVIDICQQTSCMLWVYPSLYEVMIGRLKIQEIAGIPLIELNPTPLTGWYSVGKRLLDLTFALTGLFISIPLIIPIVLLIKIDSSGPILYTQVRLGKDGTPFNLYKFRTMAQDAEKNTGPVLASQNDPRVTRIGKYLRKFRLDEIPQLFSVLKGDMSLVGPRPERPELMDKFSIGTPHFHKRLAIAPGLTGLAQIQGRYDMDIESKIRYDLAYMYNVSLLLDLKIMFATIKVVFTGKGAR